VIKIPIIDLEGFFPSSCSFSANLDPRRTIPYVGPEFISFGPILKDLIMIRLGEIQGDRLGKMWPLKVAWFVGWLDAGSSLCLWRVARWGWYVRPWGTVVGYQQS